MSATRLTLGLTVMSCAVLVACATESSPPSINLGNTGVAGEAGASSAGVSGGTAGVLAGTAGAPPVGVAGDGAAGFAGVGASGGGSGGAAGTAAGSGAGAGGLGAAGAAGAAMECLPGPTVGNTVLLIGDSYVDINNKAFGAELQKLAKAAGALGASDKYTDRSVSGTQMVGGLIQPTIPAQYAAENNADGHIKTVVMDGGGNDVLLGNRGCITTQAPPASQSCVNTIDGVIAAANMLFAKMAADGVEHVVYFFYPYLPGGGLGGIKALEDASIDYAVPLTKAACENAPVDCTFVDTRGLFGETAGDFQDGIHPTVTNINKISAAVWGAMVNACIAQ